MPCEDPCDLCFFRVHFGNLMRKTFSKSNKIDKIVLYDLDVNLVSGIKISIPVLSVQNSSITKIVLIILISF